MGYSDLTKGYLLYNLRDKNFFLSRNVEFRESIFPFDVPTSSSWQLFPSTHIPFDHDPSYDPGVVPTEELGVSSVVPVLEVPAQRKSHRSSKALLWLQDYVAFVQLSPIKPLYSIDQYIGYDHLSSSYKAFLSSFGTDVEPATFKDACKDSRSVKAILAEISALEDHKTWQVVLSCPEPTPWAGPALGDHCWPQANPWPGFLNSAET
ncbi:hypothetical protein KY284_029497 [Solanum tuberosum]|nr:hypothetical protein KY284_029497 [Solanum tuberosum]